MHINVEEFSDLCESYPELKTINDITAKYGEKSDISELCEVVAHLYKRLDSLQSKPSSNLKAVKTDK